jgi:flagellar biosynthetic protein FliQ
VVEAVNAAELTLQTVVAVRDRMIAAYQEILRMPIRAWSARDRPMTADQVLDVAREAIFVLIKLGAPIMVVALVVGVAVALLQALTQMQEMTLSFVPKLLAIFLTTLLALPFMTATLVGFGEDLFRRIAGLG